MQNPARYFFLLFLFVFSRGMASESDSIQLPGSWSLGIKVQHGFILAHRPLVVYLQQEKVKSMEVSILWNSHGRETWEHSYNFPQKGFAYQWFNLGNPALLGNAHAAYGLVYFPLSGNPHLRLMARMGLGLGYIEKIFNRDDNYKNQVASSHLNGFFTAGVQFRANASKRNQFCAGIDFNHFSNGAVRLPNLGINVPAVNVGYVRFMGQKESFVRQLPAIEPRKFKYSIYLAGGLKAAYPPTGKAYKIAAFVPELHWTVKRKSLLGGGLDYFYDETLQQRIYDVTGRSVETVRANTRLGFHFSYGMHASKLAAYFQTGAYLYNAYPEDAIVFSRLSIRYAASQRLFVCCNLKTHFGKADFFEWGAGYQF